ncbi:hypothetical protein [Komagataeibacter sp. FXV3]|uniref:hypothetical protein n=1 Tax=Komagataeibacter sp. FXV3 TaxID=2608998 RepID=UPI00187BBE9C|nr:hypothetical protein [Komagataeibacter sp. FXV3]MBE7728860.1 hypothetical protein [Komagataeibacter sp. FXV3]
MTDTTTTTTTNTATAAQNYILYRTVDLMYQPGYSYPEGTTPTPPAAQVSAARGLVVSTQSLTGLTGIVVPDGFAYALDAVGKYPTGSLYTPSTAYTLAGASVATAGAALALTLTPDNDGPGTDTTVTLSDGGAGGTFSPATVTFDGCTNTAQTVTYTPKDAGAVTISATNDGALTNPASLNVTVATAATS